MRAALSIIGFVGVVLMASESDWCFPLINFLGLAIVTMAVLAGRMVCK